MREHDLMAAMDAEFKKLQEGGSYLEVSPAVMRSMIVVTCGADHYRAVKELYNAGFRGPDLVL